MKPVHFLILSIALALLFTLFPGVDRAVSHLFYDPARGFFLKDSALVQLSYHSVQPLVYALLALLVALVAIKLLPVPVPARWRLGWPVIAYIALSLAIGPGLVTNGFLKEDWGRARPAQTVEFGGTKTFSPALIPSDQCDHNCSFVTGHGAAGFYLITFAFLMAPGRRRRMAMAGAVVLGSLIGLGRMMQGAHWLSDVVFAGVFNIAIAWTLHYWIVERGGLSAPALGRYRAAIRSRAKQYSDSARDTAPLTARRAAVLFSPLLAAALFSYVALDRPVAHLMRHIGFATYELLLRLSELALATRWYLMAALCVAVFWWGARRAGTSPELAERLKGWAMVPLFAGLSLTAAGLAGLAIKIVAGRPPPVFYLHDGTYGFGWFTLHYRFWSMPSGHAIVAGTVMATLCFIVPRYRVAWIAAAAVLMAARVAINFHWLSDVLVGGYIAVVATTWMRGVFLRSGIDLAEAARGRFTPRAGVTWRERLGLPD